MGPESGGCRGKAGKKGRKGKWDTVLCEGIAHPVVFKTGRKEKSIPRFSLIWTNLKIPAQAGGRLEPKGTEEKRGQREVKSV